LTAAGGGRTIDGMSMMKSSLMWRWSRLGALLIAVAGCNSSEPGDTEGSFCDQVAQRECEALAGACSREAADCQAIRVQKCAAVVQEAKDMGRTFRPDNVGPCLDQTRTTYSKALITAEDLRALAARCARVYEGTSEANGVCTSDPDCRSPLVCDRLRCGPRRMVTEGANCANPGETCPSTQYCRKADAFWVCTTRLTSGAVCGIQGDQIECADAFRCRGGSCVDKLALDAACVADDDCRSGYCDKYPPAGMTRTCATGLNFARFSPSCEGYFGKPGPM
jgi:hypothetical protein